MDATGLIYRREPSDPGEPVFYEHWHSDEAGQRGIHRDGCIFRSSSPATQLLSGYCCLSPFKGQKTMSQQSAATPMRMPTKRSRPGVISVTGPGP
jgi:hypothetical protein